MAVSSFFSPRYLFGALIVVVLFVGFNLSRPPLETETQAQFQSWYDSAAPYLLGEVGASSQPRTISATIKIIPDSTSSASGNEWLLSSGTPTESEKQARLARVLELVKESGVYGNRSYLLSVPPSSPHLYIEVVEGEQKFSAYMPLADLGGNIQLKNLVKLLEVFSVSPPTAVPSINPTQL